MPLVSMKTFMKTLMKTYEEDAFVSTHINVLIMQLWVSHVIFTYTSNTSRIFLHSLE